MHRPRPPRNLFRKARIVPVPDTPSHPRSMLRYLVATLAALSCAVGLTVAAPAVSASAASAKAAAAVARHAVAAAKPVSKTATEQASASPRTRSSHAAGTAVTASDVRPVCAAPRRGYAQCMSLQRTNVKAHKGLFAATAGRKAPRSARAAAAASAAAQAPSGYGPAELQNAYSLPSASAGSGETVAIVDAFDDPTAEADLGTYRSQYGLPACTTANGCFEKVNQTGQQGSYPTADAGWAEEESLDVDMVSAACPSCHILLVEANSNGDADLNAAEDEAVALGAKYVSNSWAACEYSGETSSDQSFNHPGVVITAAGGDDGYDNYLGGCTVPNYPAASRYVTSVGGTSLTMDSGTSRGWTETTWSPDPGATGSGCSQYEAKPSWQTDTGCAKRMTNDVSAVSDPQTGLAVYDTTGTGGWLEVGGTSAATPIIAAVYALAGTPVAGTYPSSYPYAHPSALNDVTSGSDYDQSCTPAYFCTAGPGYDGPTGLGTPDGSTALAGPPHGDIAGTVTDASTGKPISGATVTAPGGYTATSGADGHYDLEALPTGSYDVTATDFGYAAKTDSGIQVTDGNTTSADFALSTAPNSTLSGTITDGSGHGWPLHASITIDGDPNSAVYTDPFTGQYSVDLPQQNTYTLHISSLSPGYQAKTVTVTIGGSPVQQNVQLAVDTSACDALGYATSGGSCAAVPGGLVAGVVTDANTGDPVNGSTVASTTPGESATTGATGDPKVPGGFYTLFSSHTGPATITASRTAYQTATAPVDVTAGSIAHKNWVLNAGQLSVTPANTTATGTLGQATTRKVTFTNNGTAPLHVNLGTQANPATSLDGKIRLDSVTGAAAASQGTKQAAGSPASKWTSIAAYPFPVMYPAVATDPMTGKVYSVGGVREDDGVTTDARITDSAYVYDPASNNWSPIANAPQPLTGAGAAFIDGTLYLAGGITQASDGTKPSSTAVYAYNPGSDRWSSVASLPSAVGYAGIAVLDGQLYVVGGCPKGDPSAYDILDLCYLNTDPSVNSVYRFDPRANTWAQLANYPMAANSMACAGIRGEVVCAGGQQTDLTLNETYLYDPATNTWSKGADLPVRVRHTAYAGANGKLEIATGATDKDYVRGGTVDAWQYDPGANNWSVLPPVKKLGWGGGGSCGFYKIGGIKGATQTEGADAEVLPGYDRCDDAADTPWLTLGNSGLDLGPGQSATITVTLDSAKVSQPGTYTATLYAQPDDPYSVPSVGVTMHVNPPRGWSLMQGTVTDSGGHPLRWATVTSPRSQSSLAVETDADGHYQWWLSSAQSPLQVGAAKDGYQPQTTMIRLTAGHTATVNFALSGDPSSPAYRQTTTSKHSTPSAKARHTTIAKSKSSASSRGHASQPASSSDVRQVCAAAKRGHAQCMSLVRTNVKTHKGLFAATAGRRAPRSARVAAAASAAAQAPSGYGPAELQSAYNLPSATAGGGQTVAIVDAYDDPTAEADLGTYRTQYGLPACTTANGCFEKVNQDGQASPLPPAAGSVAGSSGWDQEESLDVDMVSAACPSCHILLVEANSASNSDMYAAEDEAVTLGAKYVSNSWAECEYSGETSDDQSFNHPGVVITAAGGDNGYDNYQQGCTVPNYPAASQYVTSVGGTSLTMDSGTSRGWTETTWAPDPNATGSGCSQYEAKPTWQTDTGCANRMTNDVSAVADPATGVAVYDTFSQTGWTVFGGTSAATPIIAAVYALAAVPQAGTYPSSYPYLHSGGLNDVTSGTDYDQSCTPAYFCTAGPGYDGPTGLGTPDGTAAFTPAAAGTLTGTVTDSATGKPVSGSQVSIGAASTQTNSSGQYTITVAAGSYTVMAQAFGYAQKTVDGVNVTSGQTTTQNFALTAAANITLSGTVTDGSGHGWALHAKLTIPGTPLQPVYTNPYTGQYSISIPSQASYKLHVESVSPGYTAKDVTVNIGTANTEQNISLNVQASPCAAAGYSGGALEQFEWPAGITPQDGWTVDNATNIGWQFSGNANPGQTNQAGGTGGFAAIFIHANANVDATLTSPAVDLSHSAAPEITFQNWYYSYFNNVTADVDLSVDGGQSWQNISRQDTTNTVSQGTLTIPVPQAAGKSNVEVRFHFTATGSGFLGWYIDNVGIGNTCDPVPGGLVAGTVTDANTGDPVNGATVTSTAKPGEPGTSAATDDPKLPGGFYTTFSSLTGPTKFTATAVGYAATTAPVDVTAGAVTHQDWSLKAGRLTVSPATASATATLGQAAAAKVTFTNSGSAPMRVDLGTQDGTFTPLTPPGTSSNDGGLESSPTAKTTTGTAWASAAPYPTPIVDNAVAYDASTGSLYSVGGASNLRSLTSLFPSPSDMTAKAYVYRPATGNWAPITPLPQPVAKAQAAVLDGTLYVVGGIGPDGQPSAAVYAYHPATGTWTQAASLPKPLSSSAHAVFGGDLYIVGGYTSSDTAASSVYRYDPVQDSWTKLANYPTTVGDEACGGLDGRVVCAGGISAFRSLPEEGNYTGGQLSATYVYDPAANIWTQGADMPYDAYGMGYSAANDQLQVAGGIQFGGGDSDGIATVLSDAAQYDPTTNTWSALPSLPNPTAYAGTDCGLYTVGGIHTADSRTTGGAVGADVSALSGFDQCSGQNEPAWLSAKGSIELSPGQSVSVPLTMDSAKVTQPGTYTATLWARPYTPYQFALVRVAMHVNPPNGWTLLHGTVTGTAGTPIADATVQINTKCGSSGPCGTVAHAVRTSGDGYYQWWVAPNENPLQVTAAKDGYLQHLTMITASAGVTEGGMLRGHLPRNLGEDAAHGDRLLNFALQWHGFV